MTTTISRLAAAIATTTPATFDTGEPNTDWRLHVAPPEAESSEDEDEDEDEEEDEDED